MAALLNFFRGGPASSQPATGSGAVSEQASSGGLEELHKNIFSQKNIVKTDIVLPWESRPVLAFFLDNVLSPLECNELVRVTERAGYSEALINVGGGRQKLMKDIRDSTRCMVDDPILADLLFERIRSFLPQDWRLSEREVADLKHHYGAEAPSGVDPSTATLVSMNERLRFLRYTAGQQFRPHYDGRYTRPTPTNPEKNPYPEASFVTVQLFLNDCEDGGAPAGAGSMPRFTGGSTAFLSPRDDGHIVHVHPRAGRVLVFEHHLLHQGSPVTSGTKYALRSDAMYQPGGVVAAASSAGGNSIQQGAAAAPMNLD